MKPINKLLSSMMLVAFVTACGDSGGSSSSSVAQVPSPDPEPNTIVDVAVDNGSFTTLVAALQATGLDATLDDPNASFTVFAPTDAAFALLGQDTIDALLADPDTLSDILTYHVIAGAVNAEAAVGSAGMTVAMVNGDSVGLSLDGDNLLVNAATVITTDIMTDNGIIHVIDAVLIPPEDMSMPTMNIVDTAVSAGSFNTLVSVLQATGLDAVLADEGSQFTVFAPTDDAFAMIDPSTIQLLLDNPDVLSSILLQHVVSGAAVDSVTAYSLNGAAATTASGAMIPISINSETDMLSFGGAPISDKDIYTTNGVIHVIDAVVIADVELPTPPMSIVDVAVGAGSFNTLAAALQATGLDTVLADLDGEFTVFAPTDDAFAKLGQDTIDALLNDTDKLSDILLYHVISGATVKSDAAIGVAQSTDSLVTTANGDSIGLSLDGSNLLVNTSNVTATDVMADNGVIHVLDAVLIPPEDMDMPDMNIVETAVAQGSFNTLVTALQAAGLDGVLADADTDFTVFAPTDAAFAMIDDEVLQLLLNDTDALSAVLLQHVVSGAAVDSVTAYTLNGAKAMTASGAEISISIDSDTDMLMFGNANIVMKDIYTTNGVIHVIDAVVTGELDLPVPPVSIVDVAVGAGSFNTLVAALQATGLDAVLDDMDAEFTVFAPTDDAFALLGEDTINGLLADTDKLSDILTYHVIAGSVDAEAAIASAGMTVTMVNGDDVGLSLDGSNLLVNTVTVTMTDIMADNGIIHVIDAVLLPPEDMDMPTMNIVETAVAAGSFNTLVSLLKATDLDAVLGDEGGNFTVFAPTDDAFDMIDADILASLLANPDVLSNILLQHVVSGAAVDSITAYSLNGGNAMTASGAQIAISIDSETDMLMFGGANITFKDIYTTNGVIHVIDAVVVGDVALPEM